MRILGIVLVILGLIALIYGGMGYNHQKTLFEVGGLKATATEHKSFSVPPIVGAVSVIGGVALLVIGRRRA